MEIEVMVHIAMQMILPVASYDDNTQVVTTAIPSNISLYPNWLDQAPDNFVLANAPEHLKKPGEWFVDKQRRVVYLWPKDEARLPEVVLGAVTEIVRVEGEVIDAAPADVPVHGIVFRDLHFRDTNWLPLEPDHAGWALCNEWDNFDRPNAAVRFRAATGCRVERCEVGPVGGNGVRMDLHCMDNTVIDSYIHDVGRHGILLQGYGPGGKDVNRHNRIVNNHIAYCGHVHRDGFGILTWQSGRNDISNNYVHHCGLDCIGILSLAMWDTETGYFPSFRSLGTKLWRRDEMTRIVDARSKTPGLDIYNLYWTKDEFLRNVHVCFYIFNDMTHGGGNRIIANRAHDYAWRAGDAGAIYITDGAPGTVVMHNWADSLYLDVRRGTQIIHENIFDKHGIGAGSSKHDLYGNVANSLRCAYEALRIEGNVLFQYPILQGPNPRNLSNSINRNLYWDKLAKTSGETGRDEDADGIADVYKDSPLAEALRQAKEKGLDRDSLLADPQFIDPSKGDYRTGENSPARKLGILGVDGRAAGLTADFPARFPQQPR